MGQDIRQKVALNERFLNGIIRLIKNYWEKGREAEREDMEELAWYVLAYYAGGPRIEDLFLIYLSSMTDL